MTPTPAGGNTVRGVIVRTVVAALACSMFAYRIYLASAINRLAAAGHGEEALFGLAIDPLWRLELAMAVGVGNQGTVKFVNTLAVVLWGLIALTGFWVAWQAWRRSRLTTG